MNKISSLGGTPLTVCENDRILGVIYLKDTVKPGMVERFERLRAIGIKTIMCTGDNPLTAATMPRRRAWMALSRSVSLRTKST
mgnify:CR=1 FL=1